jgi:hypothetical protein
MLRSHRESLHRNGITDLDPLQQTSATKSANNGPAETAAACQFGAIFKNTGEFCKCPDSHVPSDRIGLEGRNSLI